MSRSLRPGSTPESESIPPRANKVLAALPDSEFQQIAPHLERVSLQLGEVVHDANQVISSAHFVCAGLVSRLAMMESGEQVEVGLIGNEGIVGSQIVLGSARTSWRTIAQAGSTVTYSLRSESLLQSFCSLTQFQKRVLRFIRTQAAIVTQIAACNCIHDAEKRLARWLLMCQDRLGVDTLPLTQEFLSQMLGVQRTTVTLVAHGLHEAGVISYSRGRIVILDRPGLENAACECYAAVRKQHLLLLADLARAD